MRLPMNTYRGEGTTSGKLCVIASPIWFLFFKQRFPFSHMLPLFQDNSIVVEATLSHFFRVTTWTKQLLFRGSYFFRTAAVFSFFRTATFSLELFFQNSFFFGAKILQSSHFFRIGSSLLQLLFGTVFFSQDLFRIKISKKELLFQSRYFCTASTFSEKPHFVKKLIFEKINFRITYFFQRAVYLEKLLFQKTLPSIAATFLEELLFYNILFRTVTISQLRFFSTVRLLIYLLVLNKLSTN